MEGRLVPRVSQDRFADAGARSRRPFLCAYQRQATEAYPNPRPATELLSDDNCPLSPPRPTLLHHLDTPSPSEVAVFDSRTTSKPAFPTVGGEEGEPRTPQTHNVFPGITGTMGDSKEFTYKEVAEHTGKKDLFIVVHDEVYNASSFVDEHPYVRQQICVRVQRKVPSASANI